VTSDAAGNSEGPVDTTFTGGTGRFKDASGSYAGSFSQVLIGVDGSSASFAIHYSQRGTISYWSGCSRVALAASAKASATKPLSATVKYLVVTVKRQQRQIERQGKEIREFRAQR
jgi:hypothetical protein